MTITLTVGLFSNRTLSALPAARITDLLREVRSILTSAGCTVLVDAATSRGEWTDRTTGRLVQEVACTWVADTPDPERVTRVLPDLAARYEQDAIACTVGQTVLIGQG